MQINNQLIDQFFAWMLERERIRLRKEAKDPWPWTNDPIMQEYKFTNVYREFDKTTVWYRENIREKFDNTPEVFDATITFRWFNLISTGKALLKAGLIPNFNKTEAVRLLQNRSQVFTGAYIIRSETGKTKVQSISDCIHLLLSYKDEIFTELQEHGQSLEWMTNKLMEFPMMGGFMAYEVVTDLRHTYLLNQANDIMTWANPGPGAMRGIRRLVGLPVDAQKIHFIKGSDKNWYIEKMREILVLAQKHVEHDLPIPLEMRDIEHCLCEFDKYLRVKNGEGRPRSKYSPSLGGS